VRELSHTIAQQQVHDALHPFIEDDAPLLEPTPLIHNPESDARNPSSRRHPTGVHHCQEHDTRAPPPPRRRPGPGPSGGRASAPAPHPRRGGRWLPSCSQTIGARITTSGATAGDGSGRRAISTRPPAARSARASATAAAAAAVQPLQRHDQPLDTIGTDAAARLNERQEDDGPSGGRGGESLSPSLHPQKLEAGGGQRPGPEAAPPTTTTASR
jgi:hypothetical protein